MIKNLIEHEKEYFCKIKREIYIEEIICLVEIAVIQSKIYAVTKFRLKILHSHSSLACLVYVEAADREQFEYMNVEYVDII
jgi:hypothetical protein